MEPKVLDADIRLTQLMKDRTIDTVQIMHNPGTSYLYVVFKDGSSADIVPQSTPDVRYDTYEYLTVKVTQVQHEVVHVNRSGNSE